MSWSSAIRSRRSAVASPFASARESPSKKPTMAAGAKRFSFRPAPSDTTLNVCGTPRGT